MAFVRRAKIAALQSLTLFLTKVPGMYFLFCVDIFIFISVTPTRVYFHISVKPTRRDCAYTNRHLFWVLCRLTPRGCTRRLLKPLHACFVSVYACPSHVRLGAGPVFTADPAVVVFWHGQHIWVLGVRGRGCWSRGHHAVYVQNRAVRSQLVAARSGAVVLGYYCFLGGGVFVEGAGGAAVGGDAAAGHRNDVVPIQVGGSTRACLRAERLVGWLVQVLGEVGKSIG